ncbi:MAG: 3-deoxy-7-phosphoheptulonate synthase, partial [Bartonella sp.]|nr:3-deoxy-7-phosphoheptulonate synthase [Bartonella sp.]
MKCASLKNELAAVAEGQAFLLQGRLCRKFCYKHKVDLIRDFFRVFLQMAIILTFGSIKSVVKIGCTLGKFSKLRFSDMKRKEDKELPS